jgi:hypothetical protein
MRDLPVPLRPAPREVGTLQDSSHSELPISRRVVLYRESRRRRPLAAGNMRVLAPPKP